MKDNLTICIIGLGYVGLPLAVEFSKKYNVFGYDINQSRVSQLNNGLDTTKEVEKESILNTLNKSLTISCDEKNLAKCNFYIVTVPTPVDKNKNPILKPLISATNLVSKYLTKDDFVVYESTVYPGLTEEICLPILEKETNLKLNHDFYLGYSPERINPGDKNNDLTSIVKVTSGSCKYAGNFINKVYSSIIKAGTYLAPSIKVAEAAKVIENSQRDINIAFMNELALIFNKIGIDTREVIKAASTKWNFIKFEPGLVGGHCIGVDPYYLAQKALQVGHHPEVILAGRRINDSMPYFISNQIIKIMIDKNMNIKDSKILFLGITFKENCPDIRNSASLLLYKSLFSFNDKIDVVDPYAEENIISSHNVINFSSITKKENRYDVIIIAVKHRQFLKYDYSNLKKNNNSFIYDVKGFIENADFRL